MLEENDIRDDVLTRQRKELRDLVATTTGLKKQATKKTRKNVLLQCADLENALRVKHEQELAQLDQIDAPSKQVDLGIEGLSLNETIDKHDQSKESTMPPIDDEASSKSSQNHILASVVPLSTHETAASSLKKRNRQKERLEKRKLEIERIKAEAAAEAEGVVDYRQIEMDSMAQILTLNNLMMHEIRPDGHCLFALIQDQLIQRHGLKKDISELRREAANHISENASDFAPFLFDEETCELIDVDLYVDELANTAMWGSDMEILALGRIYDCPITVYIAGAQELVINPQGFKEGLKLGFYKHSFGLGEHYNSLREIPN